MSDWEETPLEEGMFIRVPGKGHVLIRSHHEGRTWRWSATGNTIWGHGNGRYGYADTQWEALVLGGMALQRINDEDPDRTRQARAQVHPSTFGPKGK